MGDETQLRTYATADAFLDAYNAEATKAELARLVDAVGFYAVLKELTGLAGGLCDGLLRFYIKSAADVAKNAEFAARTGGRVGGAEGGRRSGG